MRIRIFVGGVRTEQGISFQYLSRERRMHKRTWVRRRKGENVIGWLMNYVFESSLVKARFLLLDVYVFRAPRDVHSDQQPVVDKVQIKHGRFLSAQGKTDDDSSEVWKI